MAKILSLEELRALPDDCETVASTCLYFLWSAENGLDLLYVGGTTQPCDRIARHIRDRNYKSAQSGRPIPFKRYTFLEIPDRFELWRLEEVYQKRYDPPYNEVSYRRRIY